MMEAGAVNAVEAAARELLARCRGENWSGYDPYDALNSKLFSAIPFLDFRVPRIAATQILKRLPFNMRPQLLIPKTQNAKGLALFLSACRRLAMCGFNGEAGASTTELIKGLIALRASPSAYWCWGYSFPWQTRTVLVPRGAPNLVCTTFVANALLDAYDQDRDSRWFEMAQSAAEYLLDELYWTESDGVAGFAYPLPTSRARVHNANFLGAALLCRIHSYSRDEKFLAPALSVARYSASKQEPDGSWDYGELSTQRWKDNFHTGFNLCALRSIGQYAQTSEFERQLKRGFEFYLSRFFRDDGAPKYFDDRVYPIDAHSVAQSIITLISLKDLDGGSASMAYRVFQWAMSNMWDRQGYFYYRALRIGRIKISYMRWSQAWMLLALSMLLEDVKFCAAGSRPNPR